MKNALIGAASVLALGLAGCNHLHEEGQARKAGGGDVCAENGGADHDLSAMGFGGEAIWLCADGTVRWRKPSNFEVTGAAPNGKETKR
jgi:hypothetical protein